MLSRLRTLLGSRAAPAPGPALPVLDPAEVEQLYFTAEKLPRIDWVAAHDWIQANTTRGAPEDLRRAVMGQLFDRMCAVLPRVHRCWSTLNAECITPDRESIVRGVGTIAETSFKVLSRDLAVIRGSAAIPPIAIVGLEPLSSYVDFTSHYYPDSGEFASSAGVYLRGDPTTFPILALPLLPDANFGNVISHELTHHALVECNLPLWVEEGLTQMFEERVVGYSHFVINAEMVARQRARWLPNNIAEFLDAAVFHSPVDDTQELAYHLAEWVVRSELSRRPAQFFEFARACREMDEEAASQRVFGRSCEALVHGVIGGD